MAKPIFKIKATRRTVNTIEAAVEKNATPETVPEATHVVPSGKQSSPATNLKCVLTIYLSQLYAYTTNIWIFNKAGQLIALPGTNSESAYTRKYELTPGDYIVRIEINGQVKDNAVAVYTDKNCGIGFNSPSIQQVLSTPKLYSAALLGGEIGYETSHEYYTEPAKAISAIYDESLASDSHRNSGLFIFLRYASAEKYKNDFHSTPYWKNFSLLDQQGKTLLHFPDKCTLDDNTFLWNYVPGSGYLGIALYLKPGLYFLKYSGAHPRMVPVYVYDKWYTQLFMTLDAEPLFGTIRILISAQKTFDPTNPNHFYIDICLDKLQNHDFTLEGALLDNIAMGKYESPMLGLLGAYIYLSGTNNKNDTLFKTIIRNLKEKILPNSSNSPDIWALNLLSYKHFGQTIEEAEINAGSGTPMLRVAFDALRNAAVTYPWLIPEGSFNDHIAENQVFDSPYNSFSPFRITTDLLNKFQHLSYINLNVPKDFFNLGGFAKGKAGGSVDITGAGIEFPDLRNADEPEFILPDAVPAEQSLKDALSNSKSITGTAAYGTANIPRLKKMLENPEKIGPTGCAIINTILQHPAITTAAIAQQLQVPVNTVARIMKQLVVK